MKMWHKTFLLNRKIATKLSTYRAKSADQGFLTLEMVIASWVGYFFLVFALQAVLSGLAFKVIAQKEFGGDRLIQEEIERLNDLATTNSLALAGNRLAACDGTLDLDGDGTADDGHGQALWNLRLEGNALTANTDPTISVAPNVNTNNTIVGLPLTLTGIRNTTDPGGTGTANPFRVLGINYVVTAPDENGNPEEIATRYVEVIPDEALECP